MQLNEASLMQLEAASVSPRRGSGSVRAIDSGSSPSPKVLIRFNFSGPLWLGVISGQRLLAATENSFFSYSGAGQMKCSSRNFQKKGGLWIPALG